MRSVTGWPENTGTVAPSVEVLLNGAPVPVEGVSVTREIPRPAPGQVSAVGGVVAATGDVSWGQESTVTGRVPTPWTSKSRPAMGDRVEVNAGRAGANTRVFTGMVDNAPGQFSEAGFSSAIVDDIDRLNRTVSWDALALSMPPWDANVSTDYRRQTGLTGVYVTDLCLRAGGFNATPPRDVNSVVSAPLMGCTWPEQGALMDSCRVGDIGNPVRLSPRWTSSRWGVSTYDAYAKYLPFLGSLDGKISASTPLNITVMSGVSANLSASGYVMAYMTDGTILRIGVTSSRSIVGQVVQGGTTTTVVTLSQGNAGGEWQAATLRIYPSGSGWEWKVETNLPGTATATSTVLTTAALSYVTVYAPEGTLLGGAQVSFAPLTRGAACKWTQNANVSVSKIWYLDALPTMPPTPALDVLKAQAEAVWAGLWIDEDGTARWRSNTRMIEAAPVATLTAANLVDVQFRMDSQDIRRKVVVDYTAMAVSTTRHQRLVAHAGSRDELAPGDSQEVWIEPAQGEHWILVDDTALEVYGNHGLTTAKSGVGTIMGFTGVDSNGDEVAVVDSSGNKLGTWTISLEKVGTKLLYKCTVTSLPSGVNRVVSSTSANAGQYADRGLPLVRSRGLAVESAQTYTSAITGPEWAAEYTHPGGWFIQHADHAKDLGDSIAYQVNVARPVVESVEIIADPRLQLGDKIVVQDAVMTGVTITGVITGITQSMSPGDHTMSLQLMVTQVTTPNVTVDEFDSWYDGMTVEAVDAMFAGSTLEQVDGQPLR